MDEWHTSKNTSVYHNNTECTEGNNIEPENYIKGKGGYNLCTKCKNLNI